MKKILIILLFVSITAAAQTQTYFYKDPFAHTYSIVAIDPETGDMAVGVQSHWFSVGSTVSWGEAGVGVVATQSFVNKSFGPRALKLLNEGKTAEEALKTLLDSDEGREVRQVSILDNKGRIATFTGEDCIPFAGHLIGDTFSAQANMMLNDDVWGAMARAYQEAEEMPLAERIVLALKAAQSVGGDIRGRQSAALLVVSGNPDTPEWEDPMINLRVDDHPQPLEELERLLKVYRAYEHMNNGDLALETANMKGALAEYNSAMEMFPDNLEMKYWTAVTLASNGQLDKALPMFRQVFSKDKNWKELTRRLAKGDLVSIDKESMDKILSQ